MLTFRKYPFAYDSPVSVVEVADVVELCGKGWKRVQDMQDYLQNTNKTQKFVFSCSDSEELQFRLS
jgi:hypothetical protein